MESTIPIRAYSPTKPPRREKIIPMIGSFAKSPITTPHTTSITTYKISAIIKLFTSFALNAKGKNFLSISIFTHLLYVFLNPLGKTPRGYIVYSVINYFISLIAACAAARRAMGTRKGEQDT